MNAVLPGSSHAVPAMFSVRLDQAAPTLAVALRQTIVRHFHKWHGLQSSRWCSSQSSLTSHLNRGVDSLFKTFRVVGRGLVSVAEVHAKLARVQLAQSEAEMARD
jgi:hypothetical protein